MRGHWLPCALLLGSGCTLLRALQLGGHDEDEGGHQARALDLRPGRIKGYVVNLERRKDRRQSVAETLKKNWPSLDYEFFAAKEMDPGRMGCRLSHFNALQDYKDKLDGEYKGKYDAVIIMEDDVNFTGPVEPKLQKGRFPPEWDMLFVSYRPKRMIRIANNTNWYRAKDGWSMLSYVVSNDFLPHYLTSLNNALKTTKRTGKWGHTVGFEHISGLGREKAEAFMRRHKVCVPKVLWATLTEDPDIGESDLMQQKSVRSNSEIEHRVHWTVDLPDVKIEKPLNP